MVPPCAERLEENISVVYKDEAGSSCRAFLVSITTHIKRHRAHISCLHTSAASHKQLFTCRAM